MPDIRASCHNVYRFVSTQKAQPPEIMTNYFPNAISPSSQRIKVFINLAPNYERRKKAPTEEKNALHSAHTARVLLF